MLENPFFYLTVLGLCVKLWVILKLFKVKLFAWNRVEKRFYVPGAIFGIVFLMIALAQSMLELLCYYELRIDKAEHSLFLMKLYYVFFIAFLIILPNLFFNIIYLRISKILAASSLSLFIFMYWLVMKTGWVIIGINEFTYAFTAVKGEYYWIVRVFGLAVLFFTMLGLGLSYLTAKVEVKRVKSINVMIGFIPMFVFIPLILLLMKLGVEITAAGIASVTLSLATLIVAENLRQDRILDLRAYIPGTIKYKLKAKASQPFIYCTTSAEYTNLREEYEYSLMEVAESQFKLNTEKAKWLGVSEPTFYKKKADLKKYKSQKKAT